MYLKLKMNSAKKTKKGNSAKDICPGIGGNESQEKELTHGYVPIGSFLAHQVLLEMVARQLYRDMHDNILQNTNYWCGT